MVWRLEQGHFKNLGTWCYGGASALTAEGRENVIVLIKKGTTLNREHDY